MLLPSSSPSWCRSLALSLPTPLPTLPKEIYTHDFLMWSAVAVGGPGGRTEEGREREAEMSTAAGREAAWGGGGGSDRSGSRAG